MPSATTATCSAWRPADEELLRRAARATAPEVRAGAGLRQVRLRGQTPGGAAPRLRHRERAAAGVEPVRTPAAADPAAPETRGGREARPRTRTARMAPARTAPENLRRERAELRARVRHAGPAPGPEPVGQPRERRSGLEATPSGRHWRACCRQERCAPLACARREATSWCGLPAPEGHVECSSGLRAAPRARARLASPARGLQSVCGLERILLIRMRLAEAQRFDLAERRPRGGEATRKSPALLSDGGAAAPLGVPA